MRAFVFVFVLLAQLLVHAQSYVDINDMRDPDFRKYRNILTPDWSAISIHTFRDEKNRRWVLQVVENYLIPDGPTWFVPHDNENDAFRAGVYAVQKYGGRLLALDCGEKRKCGRIDPNRNFLPKNKIYSDYILKFFRNPAYPVLTLHNNHNKHQRNGGRGVISAGLKRPYRGATGYYRSGDQDDLIIFADENESSRSDVFRRLNPEFEKRKMNAIFEHVNPDADIKGHLSAYVVKETRMGYMNVEAQFGHEKTQKKYVDQLMSIIEQR